jgi:hypothetical protein
MPFDRRIDRTGKVVVLQPSRSSEQLFSTYGMRFEHRRDGSWRILNKDGKVRSVLPAGIEPLETEWMPSPNVAIAYRPKDNMRGIFNIPEGKFHALGNDASVDRFSDELAAFHVGSGTGYINESGAIVIPAHFPLGYDFHEGLARVDLLGGKRAYIDKRGRIPFQLPNDCSWTSDFSEGLAAIAVGGKPIEPVFWTDYPFVGSKWEFIDTKGKVVIPPLCEAVRIGGEGPQFHEGLAAVIAENGNFGFINRQGKWVLPPIYSAAEPFKNGSAFVTFGREGFMKRSWLAENGKSFNREYLFNEFLTQFKLIGMTKKRVVGLLGEPQKRIGNRDLYVLNTDPPRRMVEISYSDKQIAQSYRYRRSR